MAMVCPQCSGTFEQRLQCPSCGVRLVYQAFRPSGVVTSEGDSSSSWQHTPWGRILVGLLVAQGLSYGLQQAFTAGLMASVGDHEGNVWMTLTGLLVLQGLQLLGLLAGGTLVGAGQRRALLYGALVGVWNGLLFLVLHGGLWNTFSPVTLYGQPILQMAFGAVGGYVGMLIWPPPPALAAPARMTLRQARPTRKAAGSLDGPILWWRVLAGAGLAIAGCVFASAILDFVLEAGRGRFSVRTHLEDQLLTIEIIALVVFTGGALAGANTANGLKQGLVVGVGVATVMLGLKLGATRFHLEAVVMDLLLGFGMSLAGGWFGSQLFPPLLPPRPKGLGPEA
jgi:hypothetical protein